MNRGVEDEGLEELRGWLMIVEEAEAEATSLDTDSFFFNTKDTKVTKACRDRPHKRLR